MTDNFKIIKEFIQSQWAEYGRQFDSFTDAFYTIEIIERAKDNARIIAGNHKFKTYYIRIIEDLDEYEKEIKLLCDTLNMRAYISINHKSMRQVTLNTMVEYSHRIANNDFNKPYSIFESCAAKFIDRSTQLWIVDVDKEECEIFECGRDDLISYYRNLIENKCEPKKKLLKLSQQNQVGTLYAIRSMLKNL